MYKYLLGPVLSGAAYAGGAYYGADAEQTVHESPDAAYSAVAGLIDNLPASGTTHFDGGAPTPYEIRVDRTSGQKLAVAVLFDGRPGAQADFDFVPQNGGSDTLMVARIHGERAVLSAALAGTDKARLAYAPDWMLNLTAKPLLKQLAAQIETGEANAGGATLPGFQSQADWESSLPPDQQKQVQQWRQYEAARPTVDPDAAARAYLGGEGPR